MALSPQSIENLIDLVEVKVSDMEIYDQEDARDLEYLAATWSELTTQLADRKAARERLTVVTFNPQNHDANRAAA
jgi:hypothetical protein